MFFVLRGLLILFFLVAGYVVGGKMGHPVVGVFIALGSSVIAILMEALMKQVPSGAFVGGMAGLVLGLLSASLILRPFRGVLNEHFSVAYLVLASTLGYGGFLVGLSRCRQLTITSMARMVRGEESEKNLKVLDTSVIIDGRIADICETGFIDGEFIVPQFVLQELQHIADSPDALKRARGRRGLDILNRMQKIPSLTVRITDEDFPKIKEVDSKLVALGRRLDAKLVTNDFNLNKVAELQGVTVLNINNLANAIRSVVLPGEHLHVFVVKEGKESNQGVAYLDDGTMVVVDGGRKFIGSTQDVTVTSVLQTTAGRMVFTKSRDEFERDESRSGRN